MASFTHLFIIPFITPVFAYNNGQFKHFYAGGSWNTVLTDLLHHDCKDEYAELTARPEKGGWILVSCILDNFTEIRKTEMAIVSVVLGLLPMALQFVGPRVADVAVLGMRRPVLAVLISLGSTCATLQSDYTGLEAVSRRGEDNQNRANDVLWPEVLIDAPVWAKALISIFEYGLVGTAAANSLIQGYQLSFWAISFISMIMGSFGNTAEAFSPLLWVFIPIPIQALGVYVLYLGRPSGRPQPKPESARQLHPCYRAWRRVRDWAVREMTPCAFKKGETVTRTEAVKKNKRYWLLFLNWAIKFLVWVQVIYGTIVLSSVLFLSLFTAMEVVGRFLAGAIVCRFVLEFEMYGLQEVSKLHR
ncbi:uncharacterized protein K460DRAFT_361901 [Cucurbitaria berberidis CBS 394.84]|uniref:MFS general substrate transporter n=1 Tax=Cucurbitaria berberidis CBS 394.84 TaxID=1168544 RepID=A0A9P4GTB4_9PLEO|nr:uncharacterized protein K460DRAFT_361901 [Cucurbitaria berberidis CBS 394.84]KAF1851144.1 hypothetical protein K460DRAFT_361901 [Cucurbitaria berberidis CBS 394.84]